ncbi:MAG: ATP-binding cassette domain-containing protein [Immundisolibacter sp.]
MQLTAVHKQFRDSRRQVSALDGVTLTVSAGRITGLLGPDGAGKTTLLRLAAGLLWPDRGAVTVFGRDTRSQAAAVQNAIGYMPQRFGLYEDLTVQENLTLYADLQGLDGARRRKRFDELLQLTALGPFGRRRAGALSGGMKQKLGLACALLRTPPLLLLDEPTVGVDPISRRELWAIIQKLRAQGTGVLLSTAYMDEAERCEDVVLLHRGRLLAQQSPAAFAAPLAGHCFLVSHAHLDRRALQSALLARRGVIDALVQATAVRVVLAEGPAPAQPGETWQPVPPRVEDAFVARLAAQRDVAASATAANAVSPVTASVAAPAPTVIEVHGLRRSFGRFEAVRGIDFSVARGEVFGLLGANGAGKSTTFRMLCGLLPPTAGTVRVSGVDLRRAPARARARIGYVAQRFALYANLSVAQNLRFFASAYGLRGRRRAMRLDWAWDEFELGALRDAAPAQLPMGFKQRLALACALLHEPDILFLDEPTSGVDPLARREFWVRINRLAQAGVTVLVTTHFMDEAEYCDRLALMSMGEVLSSGSPQQIRAQAAAGAQSTLEDAFIALIQAHEAGLRRPG